ncbi:MAG: phosphoribosyltransferase family protein [Promethearchaeota archaeon]
MISAKHDSLIREDINSQKTRALCMNKLTEMKTKIFAVEVLQLLKHDHSYKQLSKLTRLPVQVLSRYVNGHVLPNYNRSKEIIQLFTDRFLIELLKTKIRTDSAGGLAGVEIRSDPVLLDKVAKAVFQEFNFMKIGKVLTRETGGIFLAVPIGKEFGVKVVVARKEKEMGVSEFDEVRMFDESGKYSYLYIPANSIKKRENILIVDDFVRSGKSVEALMHLCERRGAVVSGVFALASAKTPEPKMKRRVKGPILFYMKL